MWLKKNRLRYNNANRVCTHVRVIYHVMFTNASDIAFGQYFSVEVFCTTSIISYIIYEHIYI